MTHEKTRERLRTQIVNGRGQEEEKRFKGGGGGEGGEGTGKGKPHSSVDKFAKIQEQKFLFF